MDPEKQGLLGSESKTEYRSIDPRKPPLVFCVHGNKWGVAECCEELDSTAVHCHQDRTDGIDKKARRKLILASVLCIFFIIGEVVGGVLANSLAIATDAAHLLTDFASFMISLFAIYMASKPRSQRMSFGWHRAEVLGAIVSVLMIWVVTGILVYLAVLRIINGDYEIDATIMLATSGVGVGVNIVMGCSLHQHGHTHGGSGGNHEHSHEQENINVKAAFIHVVGDFIQSLGVFIAALVIYFKPEWVIIDPICTFIFGILVLLTTIKILKDTVSVLLEATPPGVDYEVVRNTFLSVDGIRQIHNLRIWGLTTNKTALAAHLAIEKGHNAQHVLSDATRKIRDRYDLYEMTLQIEEFQPEMISCGQCKDPSK
ncbi:zinc transporter 2 isoform X3 [Eurytemora carolleeae]|uniref:zinc transporter 2 isoform X3 n=1 Tax=Eurytemora carolleeae TaxID=1294199 RepID=UPI000C7889B9|nr:zinc transporter 2 isoform X3 [Eurytemora carolleeae]|eukprot:XP_023343791.1 zinc transporter 2-like isoform X3 [Eurytemora affinis]